MELCYTYLLQSLYQYPPEKEVMVFDIFLKWYRVTSPLPDPLRVQPIALYIILNQYYRHWIMGECGDVGRSDGIVARGERGGTQVAGNIDR